MKVAINPPPIYDLAAMRGWRTVRLDRLPSVKHEAAKHFKEPFFALKKAA